MKKVIIVSYVFPPSPGIGGRRWVKFAKYFVKMNYDIRIVTSKKHPKSSISNWIKDLKGLENKIENISSNYPYYLGINPTTFYQKIAYRLSLFYAKIVLKGNYYDKGGFWGKKLQKKIEYYITQGYNNVIVSVAPFHNAVNLIPIIKKYNNVNFIVDFRDPWIDNKTAYGYKSLSKRRQDFEVYSQKQVLDNYTHVVTVSDHLTNHFKSKNPFLDFLTIENGFDKEDFKDEISIENDGEFINLLFAGSFYQNAEYLLKLLNEALIKLKSENFKLYNKIKIKFIGRITFSKDFYIKSNPSIFSFSGEMSLKSTINHIINSDACLLFLTDDINYSLSTKFCEYLYCKKPILVFSKPGETTDFVTENNLGFSIFPNEIFQKISNLESILLESKKDINSDLLKRFDIANLVKKYDSILI